LISAEDPAAGSHGPLKVTPTRRPDHSWPRCARCGKRVHPTRLIKGFGRDCATFLGLIGSTVDTGQDGPDLLDILAASHPHGSESASS
jgi:hypothetical protein